MNYTFQSILENYNIPVAPSTHEHVRHGWLQIDCPYCTKDTLHFRMGYNIRNSYVNCWSCGPKNLISTLIELTNESYSVIKQLVGNLPKERIPEEEHKGKLILPEALGPLLPAHKAYLKARRLNPKTIEGLWGIKGLGIAGRLSWRIWIPIYLKDKVVSWTTRSLSDEHHQRYLSAGLAKSTVSPKDLLFGEHFVRDTIILVEGPMDVFRIGPGAVATLGSAYTVKQLLRISKYPRRVILFDGDKDGQRQAIKLCRNLEVLPGETYKAKLESGKDAGEADEEEITELRKMFLERKV